MTIDVHRESFWNDRVVYSYIRINHLSCLTNRCSLTSPYTTFASDKQEFYGKSQSNSFQHENEKAIDRHKHTSSFHVHETGHVAVGIEIDRDGSVESALVTEAVTPKQRGSPKSSSNNLYHHHPHHASRSAPSPNSPPVNPGTARQTARAVMQRADARGGHNNSTYNDMTDMSLYDQAASVRNNGHYQVDDYSFSTIKIHSPKEEHATTFGSPKRLYSNNDVGNTANAVKSSILKMPKWMQAFARTKGYTPGEYGADPNITKETNLAPPIRGEYQDHWASSPKVTFDTGGHFDEERSQSRRWNGLSHTQRIGAGVIWVALMCILMGVTIWSLNQPPPSVYGENASSAQGLVGAANTGAPTSDPTPRPTRPPISLSPVAGYWSLHGKVRIQYSH